MLLYLAWKTSVATMYSEINCFYWTLAEIYSILLAAESDGDGTCFSHA